jgi:sulfite exporter TauE/SafE
MSLLPGNPSPYLEAFALGLSYGLVFCTSACLPYIASYIAGIGAGFRKGVIVTLIYNSGRVTAYALIGATIGAFKLMLSSETLSSFQAYSSFAFAIITIAIGASLLLKSKQPRESGREENEQEIRFPRFLTRLKQRVGYMPAVAASPSHVFSRWRSPI